jgi:hypothetical protein
MTILKCLNKDYSENVDENELFDNNKKQITAGSTPLQPITIYGDDDDIDVKDEASFFLESLSCTSISRKSHGAVLSSAYNKPSSMISFEYPAEFPKLRKNLTSSVSHFFVDDSFLGEIIVSVNCSEILSTPNKDFLQLKDSKKNDDAETPMDTSEETKNESENKSFSFPPPPQIPCDENGQSRRSLPKEYKNILPNFQSYVKI